ncbi:MAG: MMPL family transporter, partial [Oceanospirillales bacterium]|nr:MMPL family transporter [Oceanospirillales bacterium]
VLLIGLRDGQSLGDAYRSALRQTGRIVMLTGATLAVAVATWVFSPIRFQADMGILLAFMFLFNMLGALILLPALAHLLFRPEQVERSGSEREQTVEQNESGVAKAQSGASAYALTGD